MARRRTIEEDSLARTALLNAAEKIMVTEGYAAVTTRRLGEVSKVNKALVYYYFDSMDDLFIALFRRNAERSFERQRQILAGPQPLWGLWNAIHEQSGNAITSEFNALANHRKAIREVIAQGQRRYRQLQLEMLSGVLESYGVDTQQWPLESVILLIEAIYRFLLLEDAFDIDIGHDQTIALVERHIRMLEGERMDPQETPNSPHRGESVGPLSTASRQA
jgi:AcrR family transcriptional regulator